MLKLMEVLDEHDDVQKVHANFDIPDEVMEKVAATAAG
jgi:transcriptional/translational regulatory protein YebC/TACO1